MLSIDPSLYTETLSSAGGREGGDEGGSENPLGAGDPLQKGSSGDGVDDADERGLGSKGAPSCKLGSCVEREEQLKHHFARR